MTSAKYWSLGEPSVKYRSSQRHAAGSNFGDPSSGHGLDNTAAAERTRRRQRVLKRGQVMWPVNLRTDSERPQLFVSMHGLARSSQWHCGRLGSR